MSTVFSTGALHSLEKGAIIQTDAALHVSIFHGGVPSVSTQIATLRRLLKGHGKGALGHWFARVADGEIPLVINVHNADAIASLIRLKKEVEDELDVDLKLVFVGATEAHLLAREIAKAGVGVILAPVRPFPRTWEQRRM